MKAVANEYEVPAAAVLAIEAGCDGVLICSGDHDTQAATLEALIHAVEEERLPLGRVEDALRRQQRAKERFLATAVPARPPQRQGAASGARPRRPSRDRRRDGALRVMLKPRALAPGDRLAVVAPASPFDRDEFDCGIEEIRRLGFVPMYDDSVFAQGVVCRRTAGAPGDGHPRGLARSRDRGHHRRSRRLWQRAAPSVARSRRGSRGAQAVHRLQRFDRAADVPHHHVRHGRIPRADARRTPGPGRCRLRSRFVRTRAPRSRTDGGAVRGRRRVGSTTAKRQARCSAAR